MVKALLPRQNITVDSDVYRIYDDPEVLGGQEITVSTTVLHPGKATRGHSHQDSDELYIFCACPISSLMIVGEEVVPIYPGVHVYVPPGVFHRVINSGTSDCVFIAIFKGAPARPPINRN